MTAFNKIDLETTINTLLPDNTTSIITPAVMRQVMEHLIDSLAHTDQFKLRTLAITPDIQGVTEVATGTDWDASVGAIVKIEASQAITINAPTGTTDGQEIGVIVIQSGGGSVTFDSSYVFDGAAPTLSATIDDGLFVKFTVFDNGTNTLFLSEGGTLGAIMA